MTMHDACTSSLRREDCAKALFRYETQGDGVWATVPPERREKYRQAADLALAIADAILPASPTQSALAYCGLFVGHERHSTDFRFGWPMAKSSAAWRLGQAESLLAVIRHMARAAAGLLPERMLEARKLHATDAAERDLVGGARADVAQNERWHLSAPMPKVRDMNGNEIA